MSLVLALSLLTLQAGAIHVEAEDGALVGVQRAASRSGYKGTGYVTNFVGRDDHLELTVPAKAGIYNVTVRYWAPAGGKGFDLVVNGTTSSGMLPPSGEGFATYSAGKVELRDGQNAVQIRRGWGYYDIDSLDFMPAPRPRPLRMPPAKLVDADATPEARALFSKLRRTYGKRILSGQYDQAEIDYIRETTGKTPAIEGGDFMDYSPSRVAYGADAKRATERMIQAWRDGKIVTLSWHWNAPKDLVNRKVKRPDGSELDAMWYRGFYTEATTFDVAKALSDEKSEDYRLLLRDIDAIAVQLKKLSDAKVPVLWRPLHEADGGWFWWGAKGPRPYIKLWRLMFDRLTRFHHLHNLIWVTNVIKPDWYPGDDTVDVVGVDAYPTDVADPISSVWEELLARFDGRKMLAMTEFGGALDVDRALRFGARWAYFVSWSGSVGPKKLTKPALTRIYRSRNVVNRD